MVEGETKNLFFFLVLTITPDFKIMKDIYHLLMFLHIFRLFFVNIIFPFSYNPYLASKIK